MSRKSKREEESKDSSDSSSSSSDESESSSSSSDSSLRRSKKKSSSKRKKRDASSSSSSSSSSSETDSGDASDEELATLSKRRKVGLSTDEPDGLEDDADPASENHSALGVAQASSKATQTKQLEDSVDISMLPGWMQRAHIIDAERQMPLEDLERTGIISAQIIENVKSMGVEYLFPVQTEVIPFVLRGSIVGQDIAVSAPTGSGKTLAYAMPIVHVLASSIMRRLRALVLVPTRELVSQVFSVFQILSRGLPVRCEALYGDKSFAEEQSRLVDPATGASLVDVVIATPGRLVDHLQGTPGFTVQHLRFLVADEADRLLMQSYQDWLAKVLAALHAHHVGKIEAVDNELKIEFTTSRETFATSTHQHGLQFPPLQKMLFSATLTHNPKKIASLQLVNPHFFTAVKSLEQHLFKMPETLKQHLIVCKEDLKPLVLLYLLENDVALDPKSKKASGKNKQVLCFTSSVDSTHRLTLLLQMMQRNNSSASPFLKSLKICEYSSNLSQVERDRILNDVRAGKNIIIICSDVMSRGLDSQDISVVINYDAPPFLKTYVHRVGRTARAGREGTCYSLLRKEEARFFKQMLLKAENSKQHEIKLDMAPVVKVQEQYKQALKELKKVLDNERTPVLPGAAHSKQEDGETQQQMSYNSKSTPSKQTKPKRICADDSSNFVDRKSVAAAISQSLATIMNSAN